MYHNIQDYQDNDLKGGNHLDSCNKSLCEWQAKAKALFWLQCHHLCEESQYEDLGLEEEPGLCPGELLPPLVRKSYDTHTTSCGLYTFIVRELVQTWSEGPRKGSSLWLNRKETIIYGPRSSLHLFFDLTLILSVRLKTSCPLLHIN